MCHVLQNDVICMAVSGRRSDRMASGCVTALSVVTWERGGWWPRSPWVKSCSGLPQASFFQQHTLQPYSQPKSTRDRQLTVHNAPPALTSTPIHSRLITISYSLFMLKSSTSLQILEICFLLSEDNFLVIPFLYSSRYEEETLKQ